MRAVTHYEGGVFRQLFRQRHAGHLSRPLPPNSSGTLPPKRPNCPAFFSSSGIRPGLCCSSSPICGNTSWVTNSSAVWPIRLLVVAQLRGNENVRGRARFNEKTAASRNGLRNRSCSHNPSLFAECPISI